MSRIRELLVREPAQPGRPAHLGAASGLVRRDRRLFIVSDDETALAVFPLGADAPGHFVSLAPEPLPLEMSERKAVKPDLEVLTQIPERDAWPGGALLTLGSGATPARHRGWICPLAGEELAGDPIAVSASELYELLARELADLNIEGAAVSSDRLWLAQRGNGAQGIDALVELDLGAALDGLQRTASLGAEALVGVHPFDLGDVDGVPLTFSDLAPLGDGRLLFCAVAEDVASTYLDGPCVGAAIGMLDPRARHVEALLRLAEPHKVEGITPGPDDGTVLLVADDDEPSTPAPLFLAEAPT